jgi:hypothetical protein
MTIDNPSRRRFLARVGQAGVTAAAAYLAAPRLAWGQTTKPLLQPGDFTYLGAFKLPASSGGQATDWGEGLTYRYVNGQLRFLSTTFTTERLFEVYECDAPAPSKSSTPVANVIKHWGDIYQGKRFLDQYGSGDHGDVLGLFWDSIDRRLYWSYGDMYSVGFADDCSLGYSTLDDSAGRATAVGAWRFSSRGCKMTRGGVLGIPSWFASAYTGGRRLGVGFGGPFSAATSGPASMGPALGAFAPPQISSNPHKSSLSTTDLLGYPFNATPYTSPDRGHRDADYSTDFDGWQPKNGVGYWTWVDSMFQSGVWIDLPNKHGLLYGAVLGNGHVYYANSTTHADRGSHFFMIYDPADLAQVAQGQKRQDQIQWKSGWSIHIGDLSYPLSGWQDLSNSLITGMTFDPTTARLYVAVRFEKVFVYSVGTGTGTMPTPAAPSNVRVIR